MAYVRAPQKVICTHDEQKPTKPTNFSNNTLGSLSLLDLVNYFIRKIMLRFNIFG